MVLLRGLLRWAGLTHQMPQMPSYMNIRTWYHDTTLCLYHFRDGKITLEKRTPAKLEDGEDHLQETLITLMEPHTPRIDVALAFDFPEHLKSRFIRLANTCRNGTVEQLMLIDAEIQALVNISMLSDGLILESLVCLAIAVQNCPLVKVLAARGSPSPENETRFLWNWRGYMAGGDGISDPAATTALLRNGWLKIEDGYADQITTMLDEEMAIDRIDTLFEVGYKFISPASVYPNATYFWLLQRGIGQVPVPALHHLVARIPIPSGGSFGSLVPAAAARIRDGPATIELLLGQGLDVNATEAEWVHGPRGTALHAAVQARSVPNVKCLLQHGAKMLRDTEGKTPLELADHLHQAEMVTVFKDWLQERGLPFDYADPDLISTL